MVNADHAGKMAEWLAPIKAKSFALMRATEGQRVLDVGCGPGVDTCSLAMIVGPSGHVAGVDIDPEMVQQADAAAREIGVDGYVEHHAVDGHALAFEDASFDSSRSERVFQHVADPDQLLREMIRVTRPGGWVVVGDADHTTISIDADDVSLEWRLREVRALSFANGAIGRRLPRMFASAGLRDVHIDAVPMKLHDGQLCRLAFQMDRVEAQAAAAGISPEEISRWRTVFDQPHFFATGLYFLVSGRV